MASPESTGGGGLHFEARVTAYYLAAALAEVPARGVPGLYVKEVLTQRAALGEPLDDVIVTGISENGSSTKLSLQVKSTLTFTENDAEWIEVLGQAWKTFRSDAFKEKLEKIGVAISSYHARTDKRYQSVLSWASHSPGGQDFIQRIAQKDFSHNDQRAFVATTRDILSRHAGSSIDDDTIWRFLSVFHILHFDFHTEDASRDAQGAMDRIRHILPPDQRSQTAGLWTHLIALAGEIMPSGGGASRASLIANILAAGLPAGSSATYWRDLQKINQESGRALDSIKSTICGLRLNRAHAFKQVLEALHVARFIQIDGEPGSGKSALLKQIAEVAAQSGPVFVLKDRRICPRGWSAHANQLGISGDLVGLLSELGTSGEPILYIDGIDRINEPDTQLTINDLIRAIASESALSAWKVIVTVRIQNLDHIATWLDPDALQNLPVRTVTISLLEPHELAAVASAFPRIRPLLLEAGNTDFVLRRPFYLEAILRFSDRMGTASVPATEVELLRLWWESGGAELPDFAPAQHRRQTLLLLAKRLIKDGNNDIEISGIPPEPLEELKSAGVIRNRNLGHSVNFTHDIYEEWALCEWLIGDLSSVATILKSNREPQALVRPIQLLASFQLETCDIGTQWQQLYEHVDDPDLRPIWQRAVLTACLHSMRATDVLGKLAPYLHRENDDALKKLLNALQTLEVDPNTNFLDETIFPELEPADRVRFAQAAAWPKLMIWLRFFDWYLLDSSDPNPSLIPVLLPVFRTWQSTCSGQNIRHCKRIGEISHGWLVEFETALHPKHFKERRAPFGIDLSFDKEQALEDEIRALFLSSSGDVPELVAAYLREKSKHQQGHMVRDKILGSSVIIGRWLPKQLVDYIFSAFLVNPKDSERQSGPTYYFWDQLGIEGHHSFYPASPLQPPFIYLLRAHETQGMRLIKTICNHSINVWRWLREHPDSYREAVTPLPIEVELPWGKQIFWGDDQVYLWFRGTCGSHAVKSALMALELWAFERIDAGDPFDDVFQKVLEGNHSVAALGLAASLCLAYPRQSIKQTLPLITCPHIWMWDIARSVNEHGELPPNEIGNWQKRRFLLSAVRELNRKPHRSASIRDMVPYFVFCGDPILKEHYTAGIRSFIDRLPFVFAEEKCDVERTDELRESVSWHMEQADPQFWHSEPTEDGKYIKFWNDPPSENAPKRIQILDQHVQLNRYLRIALWAQKCLDANELNRDITIDYALSEARSFDFDELFDISHEDFGEASRQAAVAGTAYVLAKYADISAWDDGTASWAMSILQRASVIQDRDQVTFRGSIISMHPLIFAVHGFAAMLERGYEMRTCQNALLSLAIDPFEVVSEAVAKTSYQYAAKMPDFYYVLFCFLLGQCIVERDAVPNCHSMIWDELEADRNDALLEAFDAVIDSGIDPSLPEVPLPWIKGSEQRPDKNSKTSDYLRNPVCFRWDLAKKTILHVNLDVLLATQERRAPFLILVEQLLEMTIQEMHPPFVGPRDRYKGNIPFEWIFSFFHWLGKVSTQLTSGEVSEVILQRLFATNNETALSAMHTLVPSYLTYAILPPATVTEDVFTTWQRIADWIIDNPEGQLRGDHVHREFSYCAFSLLFCLSGDFRPLTCVLEEGWEPLVRFKPIVERVVRIFGKNYFLYLGVIRFLMRGGLDFTPEPGLFWLQEIAVAMKADQAFWRSNGEETVEVLKLLLTKKSGLLTKSHNEIISLIIDILVDNGVRGAGFLQQERLRQ